MYIGFFFFFFFLRIRGFALLFTICWVVFFCLDWVCFTFRIDVGLFCGLALLHFFFFNLRVFLILLKGVPQIFFKDKQIKKI